ncbi:DUF2306 domain-containing protein [Asticcacaulis sp. 201]|uniref:DUF2306 domain-containing protein n=1 Tax=Asticcacaulis sp. 201 TaxID=3028787 RepID=UPI0029166915|nr:DUF2306 domain-containing protein [Asticcacaulis sp. 201]MDV6330034.1 DUF2306 domain-containing protein [Asticcacaulis sp. 201]
MSQNSSSPSLSRLSALIGPVVVTLSLVGLAYVFGGVPLQKVLYVYQRSRLHWPDFDRLAHASVAVHIHLGVACLAILLGALQFALPKGTGLHRVVGYFWLGLMWVAAISSFFLRSINHGQFSLIHLFSVLTIVMVPRIIWLARVGRIAAHRKTALSLYFGGLVVAGGLAFLPGRLMWSVFFN